MTYEEFLDFLNDEFENIRELFQTKNQVYGAGDDVFFNFRETARRVYPGFDNCDPPAQYADMFTVLLTLMDKHLVAIYNGGLHTPEIEERMRDIIVYCLIGLAMIREADEVRKEGVRVRACEGTA